MFAQLHGGMAAWGIVQWITFVIILAAAIGIMWVALKKFGITIPEWVIQIFWIVVVAVVAIVAIHFLVSLM